LLHSSSLVSYEQLETESCCCCCCCCCNRSQSGAPWRLSRLGCSRLRSCLPLG
jgi:hypothetical protein